MSARQAKCEDRIDNHLQSRLEDLRSLLDCEDPDEGVEDIGTIYDYGLGFDYVEPFTYGDDQRDGYWRYQLSWGGPSDEFRIWTEGANIRIVEYWFLDWFDGAHVDVSDDDTIRDLMDWFDGWGAFEAHP